MDFYLQLTTKCNMTCKHCGFNCTKYGRHGNFNTIIDAIDFISDYGGDILTLGGGEPTLHPKFFDILKYSMDNFDQVWFATNGSNTKAMYRLFDIIHNEDYEECDCTEEDKENGYCLHYLDIDNTEDKLFVDLSLDPFHDPIDPNIIKLWKKFSKDHHNFNVRNTYKNGNLFKNGRAKINNIGTKEDCFCNCIIIKPTGKLKLCGCDNAPYIGDIYNGIEKKWEWIFEDTDDICYNNYLKGDY